MSVRSHEPAAVASHHEKLILNMHQELDHYLRLAN